MPVGDLEWITATLAAHGGRLPPERLEGLLEDEAAIEAFRTRLVVSPQLTRLATGEVALTAERIAGAYFRLTPRPAELTRGVLGLEGTELGLAVACAPAAGGPDREVYWHGLDQPEQSCTRLVRDTNGAWLLPGLEGFFSALGFEPGDDLIIHVRDLTAPLLVLDRDARFDRDEGLLARRNARVLTAAFGALEGELGARPVSEAWMGLDRLLKLVAGRYDYRRGTPPDALVRKLLPGDPRFLLSQDEREVRLARFYSDQAAHAYLSRLSTPEEGLGAFLEEYPPSEPGDREKALTRLRELWRESPRVDLGGMSPADAEAHAAKIVPFTRRTPDSR